MSSEGVGSISSITDPTASIVPTVPEWNTAKGPAGILGFGLNRLDISLIESCWWKFDASKKHRLVNMVRFRNLIIHTARIQSVNERDISYSDR